MRVAIIGTPWVPVPPPAYGGTETVLDGLIGGLVASGHEVAYAGHPESALPTEILAPLDADVVGQMGNTASELAHVVQAYELAIAWGAEVIHDQTLLGGLSGPADVPVVVTNHGPFDGLTIPVFERIARRCAVVAISEAQAESGPSVPITAVVHHGLDVSSWPAGDGDGEYLVFLGRMHPSKGPERAIALARAAGVPLVLAAKMREPEEISYFNERVRPLLHADADFVGEADNTMKRELLGGARALLNPIAWSEPFGMVMLEALACGTPVIASPLGAAPEIVAQGVNGYLCSTPSEFVDAISAVSSLDRTRCRRFAAQNFAVERMVEGYVAVYEALVESRTSTVPLSRVRRNVARQTISAVNRTSLMTTTW
jgi:glycosyltransferase involved in cell wall biosynthesis